MGAGHGHRHPLPGGHREAAERGAEALRALRGAADADRAEPPAGLQAVPRRGHPHRADRRPRPSRGGPRGTARSGRTPFDGTAPDGG